jgi:aspartyl-tRNA(Asn)/glutamyl-tRNA(Gln) amidotransferase subunit C
MPVPREAVAHIAELARLKLTPDELDRYSTELVRIVEFFDRLAAVDTEGIEVSARFTRARHVFREDEVSPSLPVEEALRNAPETKDNYFIVPRVI